MLKTQRLVIRVSSDDEIRALIESQTDDGLRQAYTEMLAGAVAHPEARNWYAVWIMELPDGTYIGDLCFKGLSPDGSVEIGYGLLGEFEGQGYATEAVTAVTLWASRQPGVKRIEAETDPDNAASQRVLQKAGYIPTGTFGEEGPRFVWAGV